MTTGAGGPAPSTPAATARLAADRLNRRAGRGVAPFGGPTTSSTDGETKSLVHEIHERGSTMGRPKKPTHLALLHGDDKKNPDRVNSREPIPDSAPVEPPVSLDADAQAVWDRLAPDRIAKGVLTTWDADAFALLCRSLVVSHDRARAAQGDYVPQPGCATPLTELKTAVGIVTQLGSRFGWTPADRAKLVMPDDRERGDDLLTG